MKKKELLQELESVKKQNEELVSEKEKMLMMNFPWKENLGEWHWDVNNNVVQFNPLKISILGYTVDDTTKNVGFNFFTDKLHPKDYQKTMDAMVAHLRGIKDVYEVEYRIQAKDGSYKWFYDRGKIVKRDTAGRPILLSGIVFDVTEKNQLLAELESKNQLLEELLRVDGLTKLKNYQSLIDKLEEETKKDVFLSLAIFDIDNFKKINDTHGHMFGNHVLQTIAKIMEDNVRATDMVGRLGGEEFMIIYSETPLIHAYEITERIRKKVAEYDFGNGIFVTVSAGVKQYDKQSIQQFMDQADMNMYHAKKTGKNKVVY